MSSVANFLQFLRCEGQLDLDEVEPAGQAFQVLRHAEGPTVDDAHGLEQTVAQQKTAIIDGNDRFGFRQKISVEKDNHGKTIPTANQITENGNCCEEKILAKTINSL